MFLLYTIRDTVRVAPHLISSRSWAHVLSDEIDTRYANRVLHNVGLVICLVDILSCGDCVLPPGDGAAFADGAKTQLAAAQTINPPPPLPPPLTHTAPPPTHTTPSHLPRPPLPPPPPRAAARPRQGAGRGARRARFP